MTVENSHVKGAPFTSRISLSEAAELLGITPRALRYYEQRGLFEARRDRLNHRSYDAHARHRLRWIAAMRAAGVTLMAIEEILSTPKGDRDLAREMLAAERAQVLTRLVRLDALASVLEAAPSGPLPDLPLQCGPGRS